MTDTESCAASRQTWPKVTAEMALRSCQTLAPDASTQAGQHPSWQAGRRLRLAAPGCLWDATPLFCAAALMAAATAAAGPADAAAAVTSADVDIADTSLPLRMKFRRRLHAKAVHYEHAITTAYKPGAECSWHNS